MKNILLFIGIIFFSFSTTSVFSQMQAVEGEVIIQLKPNHTIEELLGSISENSLTGKLQINRRLSEIMNIYLLSFDASEIAAADALRFLKNHRLVSNVQRNHYIKQRETISNDPQLDSQWHHVNTGANGGIADADIDSDLAWDITTGGVTALGDTIVICVIEGGDLNHEDLTENAWVNNHEIPDNGIDDDNNGFIDDYLGWNVQTESDAGVIEGSHGTAVMGMIGAKGDNSIGVSGINWDVKIMSVSGENLSNEASVVEAYNYPLVMRRLYDETNGSQGAFVVATNASWGIDQGDPADVPIWAAFYDTLGTSGILNCGATTNNNLNVDVLGDIPTAIPGDYMISVTASNNQDLRTFSGYGATTIDVAAPGGNVFSTSGWGGYSSTSGTSFASPLTAGLIGLLYSVPCEDFITAVKNNPQFGSDYVRYALLNGVDIKENLIAETVTGGRINAYNSLMILMDACGTENCLPPFQVDYEVANDTIYIVNWSGTSTMFNLRYRESNTSEWTVIDSIESNSFSFNDLEWCATYEFQLAQTCGTEELNYSESLFINTDGCCEVPENVEINLSSTSGVISWGSVLAAEEYELQLRLENEESWSGLGVFSGETEVALTDLDSCTTYEIRIIPNCGNGDGLQFAATATFTTSGCGSCTDLEYCHSSSDSSQDEYIESINIGDYEMNSGNNNGYALFENTNIDLTPEETYDIVLQPGYAGQSYSEYFKVWIDYNADGVFSNLDELVFDAGNTTTTAVSGQILIPADAVPGTTRMRVSMKYMGFGQGSSPEPCSQINFGEVEDYCVTILSQGTIGIKDNYFEALSVYPNPASSHLNIVLDSDEESNFIIIDALGRIVKQEKLIEKNTQLSLSELTGGIYFYYLEINGEATRAGKLIVE